MIDPRRATTSFWLKRQRTPSHSLLKNLLVWTKPVSKIFAFFCSAVSSVFSNMSVHTYVLPLAKQPAQLHNSLNIICSTEEKILNSAQQTLFINNPRLIRDNSWLFGEDSLESYWKRGSELFKTSSSHIKWWSVIQYCVTLDRRLAQILLYSRVRLSM